jgi:hypothetical protein
MLWEAEKRKPVTMSFDTRIANRDQAVLQERFRNALLKSRPMHAGLSFVIAILPTF